MSKPISALDGMIFAGFAGVEEIDLQGMITLRGDLASAAVKNSIKTATGLGVPGPRRILAAKGNSVAWMSPDELFIIVPYDSVAATVKNLEISLGNVHALVANVSDARAAFRVTGAGAREVVAKLAPVDLSVEAFQPGEIRRTRLAQVPAAFWMTDANTFNVVCFRSVAQYAFDLLTVSAQNGSEVGYF